MYLGSENWDGLRDYFLTLWMYVPCHSHGQYWQFWV